ncbi:MAG: hypothetical protein FJ265_19445 [Planctomycetes bacterium]|nr:hypothetical protein [Planctomycetota bacterium]
MPVVDFGIDLAEWPCSAPLGGRGVIVIAARLVPKSGVPAQRSAGAGVGEAAGLKGPSAARSPRCGGGNPARSVCTLLAVQRRQLRGIPLSRHDHSAAGRDGPHHRSPAMDPPRSVRRRRARAHDRRGLRRARCALPPVSGPGPEWDGYVLRARELAAGGLGYHPCHPYGLPLLLAGLHSLGLEAFVAGRLVSALAGAALVGATYGIARCWTGPLTALAAALALGANGIVFEHATLACSDVPAAGVLALAFACWVAAARRDGGQLRLVFLGGVCAGVAMGFRFPSAFAAPGALALLAAGPRRGARSRALGAGGPGAVRAAARSEGDGGDQGTRRRAPRALQRAVDRADGPVRGLGLHHAAAAAARVRRAVPGGGLAARRPDGEGDGDRLGRHRAGPGARARRCPGRGDAAAGLRDPAAGRRADRALSAARERLARRCRRRTRWRRRAPAARCHVRRRRRADAVPVPARRVPPLVPARAAA